jgi:hypothetical protein
MIKQDWIKKMKKNKDYKSFVGPKAYFDKIGQIVFDLLIEKGLKKHQYFLDIGCGSLRIGKHLIPWLYKNRYCGTEPNKWLIDEGLKNELPEDIIDKKNPQFFSNNNFKLGTDEDKSYFDFILANSIFIHASLNEIKKCINEVKKVIKVNGIFIFNFYAGKKDNQLKDWSYPKKVVYKKETIENILTENGFNYEIIETNYPGSQIFVMATIKE